MASQDWFEKDFYAILGVSKDADAATVKKAYRKLARTHHPDKNPGDAAAEQKFKDIGEAHAVLSDPKQREEYDAIRQMAHGGARFRAGGPGGNGGFEDIFSAFGGGGGSGVRFDTGGGSSYGGYPGGGDADINDLLSQMFGGAAGGAARPGQAGYAGYGAPRGPRKGADVQATTTLPFRDAVEGSTVTLRTAEGRTITARIPAGVKDGQKIRLRGKGQPGEPGAGAGDLILTVGVQKHPVFGREGDHLTVDLPVTFAEAALGATVPVPTLDGSTVKVRIAPGTPSGRVLRVKGRGVAGKAGTGDLLAKVQVVVPETLSDRAREAVEVLRAEADGDPRAALAEQAKA
ncbi:DnaJ C-terminal domain-containing protein [Knoellia sp. CPCC 206435]|uniref:DnaJ C-terminal domain-containing protein n=1 Tax=Knoellia terrae TaxID=3404797 RepID=UPI003B4350FC